MEAPGKSQRQSSQGQGQGQGGGRGVANLTPDWSTAIERPEEGDGVQEALEQVTATMCFISSKVSRNTLELGPVPSAKVKLEGEPIEALLDTGSPVTIVSRNYGGGRLPVVRQIQTTLAHPGHEVKAVVQVQREAPARLLIGTDLLSQLGFLFVRTEVDQDDVDLLEDRKLAACSDQPERRESGQEEKQTPGAVCLLQATRLPGRHAKGC